jgi:hypothetical protein
MNGPVKRFLHSVLPYRVEMILRGIDADAALKWCSDNRVCRHSIKPITVSLTMIAAYKECRDIHLKYNLPMKPLPLPSWEIEIFEEVLRTGNIPEYHRCQFTNHRDAMIFKLVFG